MAIFEKAERMATTLSDTGNATHVKIPMAVCAMVSEVLHGSHHTLEALFEAAGVPGPPPNLAHHSKWKMWLFKAGNDPNVDTLAILGNLIEEFMDLPPSSSPSWTDGNGVEHDPIVEYRQRRERLSNVLEEHGFRYFRGGRVLPNGADPLIVNGAPQHAGQNNDPPKPSNVEDLLERIIKGLPRAMHPLTHRRKGAVSLSMNSEWDIQDLLHSQLRPWIADIRPEEPPPSYAGSNARMDFLLPKYALVIETKRVRDAAHATKIGNELIIDIEHYRKHSKCDRLWCVIYDPLHLIPNPSGLVGDLEGDRSTPEGKVRVRVFVISGSAV
jgi:hypothetical protein